MDLSTLNSFLKKWQVLDKVTVMLSSTVRDPNELSTTMLFFLIICTSHVESQID